MSQIISSYFVNLLSSRRPLLSNLIFRLALIKTGKGTLWSKHSFLITKETVQVCLHKYKCLQKVEEQSDRKQVNEFV